MLGPLLIAILFLALLGALPAWPHSRGWGYAPSGAISTILVVVVLLMILERA